MLVAEHVRRSCCYDGLDGAYISATLVQLACSIKLGQSDLAIF